MELSPVEGRVIGSLAEKQLTTPQQYPLTLNALVLACNQTSNRDPVVSYDEATVQDALSSLKDGGLLRFVHPSHGRSVIRYRQVVDEVYGLDERSLSIIGVLLLRGPQTVGELRARTERMASFENLGDVESELERLSDRPDPLARRLARQPGRKEERWAQLLTGEPSEPAAVEDAAYHGSALSPVARNDEVEALRSEVGLLRQEITALKAEIGELRSALGE
jgi:uncharacterized protein